MSHRSSKESAIQTLRPLQLRDISRDLHVQDALLFANEEEGGFVMTLVTAEGSVTVKLSEDLFCQLRLGFGTVWKLDQVRRYGSTMLSECLRSIHLLNDDDAEFIERITEVELTRLSEKDQKRLYALSELARRRARREQERAQERSERMHSKAGRGRS